MMTGAQRAKRYRERKRGLNVPILSPGPKKGYKQSDEHILKRKRFGPEHHNWKGDSACERTGRTRAERLFPVIGPCVQCGNPKSERHHKDGNTLNNEPTNIIILCRKCHMQGDGRLAKLKEFAIQNAMASRRH